MSTVLSLLTLALLASSASAAPAAQSPLLGEVRDAAGFGVPYVEATIYRWRTEDALGDPDAILERIQRTTDRAGRFQTDDIAPGPVTVSLYDPSTERGLGSLHGRHPNAASNGWHFTVDLGPTVPIEIAPGPKLHWVFQVSGDQVEVVGVESLEDAGLDPGPRSGTGSFPIEVDPTEWRARLVTRDANGDESVWPWKPLQAGEPPWVRWPFAEQDARGGGRLEIQRRGVTDAGEATLPSGWRGLTAPLRVETQRRASLGGTATPGDWLTLVTADQHVRHTRVGADGRYEFLGLRPGMVELARHRSFGRPDVLELPALPEVDSQIDVEQEAENAATLELSTLILDLPIDRAAPIVVWVDRNNPGQSELPLASSVVGTHSPAQVRFFNVPHGSYRVSGQMGDGRRLGPIEVETPRSDVLTLGPQPLAGPASARIFGKRTNGRVRLHLRDATGVWDPGSLGDYAASLDRCPPVSGVEIVAADGTRHTSDLEGLVEIDVHGPLRVESEPWWVFPSPGFADGEVRLEAPDVVVWLRSV